MAKRKRRRKFAKGMFLAGSTLGIRAVGQWRYLKGRGPIFIKGGVSKGTVKGKAGHGKGVGKVSFAKWKKKVRKEQRINRKIGKAFFGHAGKNIKIGSRYSFDDD